MTKVDARHPTERVYDDEISPLVLKIIEIVQREGLPLLISVGMVGPNGGVMTCDTWSRTPEDDSGRFAGLETRYDLAAGIIRDPRFSTVTKVRAIEHTMSKRKKERPRRGGGAS